MRLGGTVAGRVNSAEEWEEKLVRSRFRAVTAPFSCRTPREEIRRYTAICEKHDVVIAELGVWKNPFDPDPAKAKEAMDYAKGQLALADELGVACCVNIAGTASAKGWDAADKSNFTKETYARIVASIREIIDSVKPSRAFYCLEPMPWMIPDGPDVCLKLIEDVGRAQFAAHMDFVNMLCTPRRWLGAEDFVEECFRSLAPYIKSTHIKDSRMDALALTSHFDECAPGEGGLDFVKLLPILDKYLSKDAPVLLEHMQTFEEYAKAYDYLAEKASAAGVEI